MRKLAFIIYLPIWAGCDFSGGINPKSTLIEDKCNLIQDLRTVIEFKEDQGDFPEHFSTLLNNDYLDTPKGWQGLLNSRRFSFRDYQPYEGPFPDVFSNSPHIRPPLRQILVPFDVDVNCDYLYLRPLPNHSPKAIVMMTRPGVLYRNKVHVGYIDGEVELLDTGVWQNRKDVIGFLNRWVKYQKQMFNREKVYKWILHSQTFPDYFHDEHVNWAKRFKELVEFYKKAFVPPKIGMQTDFYRVDNMGLYATLSGVKDDYAEISFQGRIQIWDKKEFRKDFRLMLFRDEWAIDQARSALSREKQQYDWFLKRQKGKLGKQDGFGVSDSSIYADYRCFRNGNSIHLQGWVRNDGTESVDTISAKAHLHTIDGGHIKSYDVNNILKSEVRSGQTESFQLSVPNHGKADKVFVEMTVKRNE